MCAAIDYRDLFQVRQVRVNVRSRRFQLERFRMGSQLIFFFETLIRRRVDDSNGSGLILAVADVDTSIRRIVAHVVDIAVEVDLFDYVKGSSVIDVQLSLAAPGEEFVGVGCKDDSLWIRNSGDGMDDGSRADIDDLDRVVSQRRNKQSISSRPKVIETSLHAL